MAPWLLFDERSCRDQCRPYIRIQRVGQGPEYFAYGNLRSGQRIDAAEARRKGRRVPNGFGHCTRKCLPVDRVFGLLHEIQIFEAPKYIKFCIRAGDHIRYGQPISVEHSILNTIGFRSESAGPSGRLDRPIFDCSKEAIAIYLLLSQPVSVKNDEFI